MERESPCCVWDFTAFEEADNEEAWISWLEENCKAWTFQREETAEGKHHLQGRISLKLKKRGGWWVNVCPWAGVHWSRTSGENRNNMFYVMKSDTRIAGPWSDTDEKVFISEETINLQKKIETKEIPKWQEELNTYIKLAESARTIRLIIDKKGGIGKTTWSIWAQQMGFGRRIVVMPDMTPMQLMGIIMQLPESRAYIFDFPREMNKKKIGGLWSAIEEIKNGHAFDTRYKFKEKYFPRPLVICFMNELPDLSSLSADRWWIEQVKGNGRLTPVILNEGE